MVWHKRFAAVDVDSSVVVHFMLKKIAQHRTRYLAPSLYQVDLKDDKKIFFLRSYSMQVLDGDPSPDVSQRRSGLWSTYCFLLTFVHH